MFKFKLLEILNTFHYNYFNIWAFCLDFGENCVFQD